jgi:hypothetical protein
LVWVANLLWNLIVLLNFEHFLFVTFLGEFFGSFGILWILGV